MSVSRISWPGMVDVGRGRDEWGDDESQVMTSWSCVTRLLKENL